MADVQKMQGTFDAPEVEGETAILKGTAAVEREINEEDHTKLINDFIENVGEAS